ncbi:MAG: shikimate kinase [Oscillospiraceae bacterium]|nr:shikimate kinase [Oscillospiraceae bacterium]
MSDKKIFGLLGRHLGHSYSSIIHRSLLCQEYSHIELEPEQLSEFFEKENIGGLNVTMPYKKDVMPHCRELTEAAKNIGSVNTIFPHPDGGVIGHNTDAAGFVYMAHRAGIEIAGKKVVIFGTGGAHLAVKFACRELGAREIVAVSRSGEDNYDNLSRHYDAEIIVNATPVGMFPNMKAQAADISGFSKLEGAIDLIYNPRRTNFLQQASQMGAKTADGLSMLVAQAVRAEEKFFSTEIADSEIERVLRELSLKARNIVLVGMPGSGKTTIGRVLTELSGLECVDTDEEIVKKAGKSIPDIFAEDGEEHFRSLEREVIEEVMSHTGRIVMTGGGCVKCADNIIALRRTGLVYHITRDVSLLPRDGRPLSANADLEKMFSEREPLYRAARDKVIDNNGEISAAAEEIWRDYLENSCN